MLGERCNVSDQKSHLAKPRKSGQISPIWRPGERCKGTSTSGGQPNIWWPTYGRVGGGGGGRVKDVRE